MDSTHQVDDEFVEEDIGEVGSGCDEESDDSSWTFAGESEFCDRRSGSDESRVDRVELLLVDSVCQYYYQSAIRREQDQEKRLTDGECSEECAKSLSEHVLSSLSRNVPVVSARPRLEGERSHRIGKPLNRTKARV